MTEPRDPSLREIRSALMRFYREVTSYDPKRLPKLMNSTQIREETGMSRAAVEALMRALPKVKVPGHKNDHVRRADVARLLEESTVHVVTGQRGRHAA